MDIPRLCIVGAGNLSTKRIYPFIGAAGAQLAGVCDLDTAKATRNAALFGGRVYADMLTMLAAEKPDGIMVCIDMDRHAELAVKAMRAGVPVYTEKPPAPSAAAALEIARVSKETGVLCTTAFKKRYNEAYSRARQWLDRFPPDDRLSISVDYASAAYSNQNLRQSFLFDFAIHAIDLVGFLFGDVTQVACLSKDADAYAVTARFACGAVGSFNFNCGRSFVVPTEEVEISIRGGNFMTVHNSSAWRICENGRPAEWREPPTFTSAGDSGNDTGHLAEIVDFLAAIRDKRSTSSNIYDSYKSMVLYEAIRDSAAREQILPVRYETL